MRAQGFDRALRQKRAQAEGHIGAVHHFEHGDFERLGQALSAEFGRGRQRIPAAFGKLAIGIGKAGGCEHAAILEARAVNVAGAVERCQHVCREATGRVQHGSRGFGVEIGIGAGLFQPLRAGQFRQRKQNIANRGYVGHGILKGNWERGDGTNARALCDSAESR